MAPHGGQPPYAEPRIHAAGAPSMEMGIAWMAHELRSPLQAVRAALARARVEPEGTSRNELIERCEAELTRLSALLEPLLTAAIRPSSIELGWADVADVVRGVVDLASEEGSDEAIDFVSSEPVQARIDRPLLQTAVLNLIRNARAYARGEPLTVSVSRTAERAAISVEDRGGGISEEEQDRLFQPFARGSAGAGLPEGTGLGLFITRRIAEAHGGRVTVESGDAGAVFRIEVPVMGSEEGWVCAS